MLKRLIKFLHTPKWLFILLIIVLLLRVPSFFEPYSYGDEMIYLTLGEAIRRGIPLYKGVHDNKPPLLYIIAAIAGRLYWFKAILAIWHLLTIFAFFKLMEVVFPSGKDLSKNTRIIRKRAQKIATVVFSLLTTLPLLEGNIVNAELFMIGPTIIAFYILLSKKLSLRKIFSSGILFSLSSLFKVPAIFDMPTIIFVWVSSSKLSVKNLVPTLKKTAVLLLGFLVLILLTIIWYLLDGALKEYLFAAFLQNIGYLSTWRPSDVKESFFVRNLPLFVRTTFTFLGLFILYLKRKRLSFEFKFASSWLLLSLFAVTLSERPYPHYLIQSVAPFSILIAILFSYQKKEQVLSIIPLTLAIFVPFYYNYWHYPTLPYYSRFLKLATKQMTKNEYLSSFGSHVPRNYKIADFLMTVTKKDEKIFVWGEASHIYALSKRFPPIKYVADYHIKDFSTPKQTIKDLSLALPSFIIVLPESSPFPELDYFLSKNYGLTETMDGAQIWKLLNPKVRSIISF